MSLYKAGLGITVMPAPQKQSNQQLTVAVAAGVISGVVLLVISRAMYNKPVPQGPSPELFAHKYVFDKTRQRGLPYT